MVLRYFHTYVGSGHFLRVQNFEFQYFLGFSDSEYFLGYGDFVDIFWSHHKIGLYLGLISMHFRVFSKGKGTEWGWNIFGVAKISIFLVCLKLLIFLGVNGRCLVQAYS